MAGWLERLLPPDPAWERDVALAHNWARWWIRAKIAVGCVAFWVFFKLNEIVALDQMGVGR